MKSSPEFCCHPVIRVPIIAGLECQGHSPPTCQVSDALLMTVKMTNSEFGNVIRLFSSSACFLFTAFLVSLHNHANIYPIAEVEYDHLFTKKSRAAQQLKTKYVTLVTLGRKLSK